MFRVVLKVCEMKVGKMLNIHGDVEDTYVAVLLFLWGYKSDYWGGGGGIVQKFLSYS